MLNKSLAIAQSAAGILLSLIMSLPATATPGVLTDIFSKRTELPDTPHHLPVSKKPPEPTSSIGAGPGALMSQHTPIVAWFEKFDETIHNALITSQEKMVLYQPMDKEVERVRAITDTMNNIAKRYRRLAGDLRKMQVGANYPGVEEYRDAKANFFEDEAAVYEDMIKPKKPAQTIEELRDQLHDIQIRSSMLKKGGEQLLAVDHDLRMQFSVHANKTNDPLWAYVSHRQGMPGK